MSASIACQQQSALNSPHSAPEMSGADIVVRALERHRIDIVAGVPGGAALPLYDALVRRSRIRHVLARHEQAAGFIAQGIARLTQRAAVCFATSGPGVTNLLTAVADAKADSVPLVCITGQVPQQLIGTDAFQEVATLDLARPITKAAWCARDAGELDELIAEAFRVAESGRPGPVWIDIPKDVQLQRCAVAELRTQALPRAPRSAALIDAAATLINRAQRPVLYVGGGVVKAGAEQILCRLAERAQIPVATTLMALGAVPHDHPLSLGMLGMHGALATNRAVHECDLLLAVGARFDDRATGDPKRFAPQAQIVHIDIDAREFGKILEPTLAIESDAWSALTSLLTRVAKADRSAWLAQTCGAYRERLHANAATPAGILASIGAILPHDAVITTDVGQHQMWAAQALPLKRADRWLTSGGLGTMGFGLPAAIGAALAEPNAMTVCITGDGSLLMNIQELATLAELALNVKIILLDNGGYGLVRQQQTLFYQRRYSAAQFSRPSDFVSIARSFGIEANQWEPQDGIPALAAMLNSTGPYMVRIPIDAHEYVLPMVPPGGANMDALCAYDRE